MHCPQVASCVFALLFIYNIRFCDAAVCGSNDRTGDVDVSTNNDNVDNNTGISYRMTNSEFKFLCCGVIERWEANIWRPGTIAFQVWRQVSGSTHKLVGENMYTTTSTCLKCLAIIPSNEQLTVMANDFIGWWTSGQAMVGYVQNSNIDGTQLLNTGNLSAGDIQDWASATTINNQDYGVEVFLNPNTSPYFTNLPASVTISKSTPIGSVLYNVSFTDDNPYDVNGLTVTMGTASSYFSFVSSTQPYQVRVIGSLTGAVGTNTLVFSVTDICPNTGTGTLTIVVTNQNPVIRNLPTSIDLSEDTTTEIKLLTINVTDADPTDTVTCSLTNSSVPFIVRLVSNSSDWGIYAKSNPNFRYDTINKYELTISCGDGIYNATSIFTVYLLRNKSPVITNLANSVTVFTSATAGYVVYIVNSTDAEGDKLYYNMTCYPPVCPFQIRDSGVVQLTANLLGSIVTGYDLSVYVYDGKTLVGPRVLTVTITGINSAPTISNLPLPSAISVDEGTALAMPVFKVSVIDPDIRDNHTFMMSSVPDSGIDYFSIDSVGVVSTSKNVIDFESAPAKSYNISISVSDGMKTDTKILVIDLYNVNEAPSFANPFYTISASEDVAGTLLADPGYVVLDPDYMDTYTFSQNCGNATGYFKMALPTGRLNFSVDYDLDTGSMPTSIICTVTATDKGGLTGTTTLSIRINNVNDNAPIFIPSSYSFYVSYYAVTPTTIGTITATDADVGTYGSISLTLNQTSLGSEYFGITKGGTIYTQRSVRPIGAGTTFVIKIIATDGGGTVTMAVATVTISKTTTVPTTTVVTGYKSFIEDSRNVVWISLCGVLGVVVTGILFGLLCKFNREGAPKLSLRRCFGRQKPSKVQHRKTTGPQKQKEPERRWRDLYERNNNRSNPV